MNKGKRNELNGEEGEQGGRNQHESQGEGRAVSHD